MQYAKKKYKKQMLKFKKGVIKLISGVYHFLEIEEIYYSLRFFILS